MRFLQLLTVCLLTAIATPAIAAPRPVPAPISGLVMPEGKSYATPTGLRLFPNHAGSAMPGWLEAYDRPAMRIMYRGYCTKETLPGGYQLVVLREQGLLGAYLFLKDRCVGQVVAEPYVLQDPAAFQAVLKRSGARGQRRVLTSADRTFGLEAQQFDRRLGPMVERRVLVTFPDTVDGVGVNRLGLGLDAVYPSVCAPRMEELVLEAEQGLAEFWRSRPSLTVQPG